jgi:Dyp-type peroxidase family
MEKVEWEDIQGPILSGYPKLPFSAYVLWRFRPQQLQEAKQWLATLAGKVMRAGGDLGQDEFSSVAPGWVTSIKAIKHASPEKLRAVNIALTSRGLRQLGVGPEILKNFSLEFLEGMAPRPDNEEIPRRTNILGDLDDSSPAQWNWGGWNANSEIDGVLLIFAADETSLQSLLNNEIESMSEAVEPVRLMTQDGQESTALKGRIYADRKEHFGYTDGISQPIIEGSPKSKRDGHSEDEKRIHFVKPGEFVLGYNNERRERAIATERIEDLRRNGTYLVLRQLEQDVAAFNDFVTAAAARVQLSDDPAENRKLVAGKLVGRYPSGEPLVPASADCEDNPKRNDFLYYFQDRFGLDCPVGAHIRRASPRDSNKSPDPETALRLSKMHRIIRRGRMYGERFDPAEGAANDKGPRGILFLCLNSDIAGQFEIIQHSWLNNRHFGDQYVGTDPLGHFAGDDGTITIQRRPINLVLNRPRPFVRVRGGAYFFMPGVAALRAMSA